MRIIKECKGNLLIFFFENRKLTEISAGIEKDLVKLEKITLNHETRQKSVLLSLLNTLSFASEILESGLEEQICPNLS